MKVKNTTLTAAVVLATGATATSQASLDTRDKLLVDIASGSLIEEGQQLEAQQRSEGTDKIVVAKKAAPKRKVPPRKKAAPRR
jgi:hypothetical protein